MDQLKGLKVLELASVLAGPAVGQFFAELGAEVTKVENIKTGGDVTRTWKVSGENTDDRSAYFCSVNWGKRSIALDLSRKEGQEIVQQLSRLSDIVIASYKPGDAEKLGVDYTTLSKENPRLIYGQISGYGPHNPRVGYDAIIQAEAGFMYMNGETGAPSLKMPVALMDVLAGHQLKEGILLAMLERHHTGMGKHVEVSLIQSGIASLVNQATNWLIAKKLPTKKGSAHPNIAPYGDVFKTADQKEVILAVGSDSQFRSLCQVLSLEYLASDAKFITNATRVVNRNELIASLRDAIERITSTTLLGDLTLANVPAGIVNDMRDVMDLPEAREMILSSEGISSVKTIAFHGFSESEAHFLPPPHFGEHTREVLEEFLKISSDAMEKLVLMKVIA